MTTPARTTAALPAPPADSPRLPRPRRRPGALPVALLTVTLLAAVTWLAVRPEGALPSALGDPSGPSALTSDGGDLPDEGVSPDADHLEGIARLDPGLLEAVRAATAAAAEDGIELRITSAWRSEAYQQQLLDDAIRTYGEREARRIVQSPDRSRHVTGDAVDIGPTDAAFWVLQHGSDVGLCQVYANEVWHYELLTEPGGECPPLRADAS